MLMGAGDGQEKLEISALKYARLVSHASLLVIVIRSSEARFQVNASQDGGAAW